MKPVAFIISIVIAVAVAGAISRAVMNDDTDQKKSNNTVQSEQNDEQAEPKTSMTTQTGTYSCLAKHGDGPQTMECASGLKLDDGTQYALGSDDPMLLAGIPTGTRIEVTGSLQTSQNKTYDTMGTIKVQTFKQL